MRAPDRLPPLPMSAAAPADFCAIDFGTSNSAVAVPSSATDGAGMRLVPLEDGQTTMPTATFYLAEGPDLAALPRLHGRAAIAAYVEGTEGRLMRSMKSVLGSGLMEQRTDIGAGRSLGFADMIAGYLRHLRGPLILTRDGKQAIFTGSHILALHFHRSAELDGSGFIGTCTPYFSKRNEATHDLPSFHGRLVVIDRDLGSTCCSFRFRRRARHFFLCKNQCGREDQHHNRNGLFHRLFVLVNKLVSNAYKNAPFRRGIFGILN